MKEKRSEQTTAEARIQTLMEQLDAAQAQIAVLVQETRLIGAALLEMSEAAYAQRREGGKGENAMAMLWTRWIITGERSFEQTPGQLKERVRALLRDAGCVGKTA
ncbi:MAG: hypothetical protein IKU73_02005 [Clostridia bacterium]|nr:hypothetical protein [Clostridia bacterium]